jgi:hypothetical protein
VLGATIPNKKWLGGVLALVEICLDPVGRLRADKYWPVFLALTTYHKLTALEIDMVTVETYEFRHTKPRRKEKLKDCSVALAWHGIKLGLRETVA